MTKRDLKLQEVGTTFKTPSKSLKHSCAMLLESFVLLFPYISPFIEQKPFYPRKVLFSFVCHFFLTESVRMLKSYLTIICYEYSNTM